MICILLYIPVWLASGVTCRQTTIEENVEKYTRSLPVLGNSAYKEI